MIILVNTVWLIDADTLQDLLSPFNFVYLYNLTESFGIPDCGFLITCGYRKNYFSIEEQMKQLGRMN